MRLEKLTDAQIARLPAIRAEWLSIGLSTAPGDRPRAEAGVAKAYAAAGLPPPKLIIWLDSPMQGAMGAALLAERLSGAQLAGGAPHAGACVAGAVRLAVADVCVCVRGPRRGRY